MLEGPSLRGPLRSPPSLPAEAFPPRPGPRPPHPSPRPPCLVAGAACVCRAALGEAVLPALLRCV